MQEHFLCVPSLFTTNVTLPSLKCSDAFEVSVLGIQQAVREGICRLQHHLNTNHMN